LSCFFSISHISCIYTIKPICLIMMKLLNLFLFKYIIKNMIAVNFTEFRNNLKKYLDAVEENEDTLIITRSKGRGAVVLSMAEYNSLKETMHLLGTRNNALHLYESMKQAEEGQLVEFNLPED
jgi:antitoxin YefM